VPNEGCWTQTSAVRQQSRRQVVALAVFAMWALLLAIGLFGGSFAGLPRALTETAGTVALIALFWFMPGGYLFVLVLERRRGAIRTRGMGALAVRWRWYFTFSGVFAFLVGLILLTPSARVTPELRLGGAVISVWGLIALSVAVVAFRTKSWRLMRVERDSQIASQPPEPPKGRYWG
jgi:hypothetical protein